MASMSSSDRPAKASAPGAGRGRRGAIGKAAVTLGLLVLVVLRVDLRQVWARFAQLDWRPAALALVLLLLLALLAARRWQSVLGVLDEARPPPSLGQLLRLVLVGQFFNQGLPSTVGGDALRVWLLGRRLGWRAALESVLLDRLTAVLALVALVAALLWPAAGLLPDGAWRTLALMTATTAAGAVLVLGLDRLGWLGLGRLVPELLVSLPRDARRLLFEGLPALEILGFALVIHLGSALTVLLLAEALGLELPPLAVFVLVPPVILVTIIPLSLAGWGLREAAMVAAFGSIGVPADDAFALSVLFGLTIALAALPGAPIFLLQRSEPVLAGSERA